MEKKTSFFIVGTPIGNLSDMSFRAIETLKKVDVILCEDTRVSKKLCEHYEIDTHRESYHAHSESSKEDSIMKRISEGIVFALISDAGMPTISDPGVKLVHRITQEFSNEIDIIAIPGPTALITALCITGFMGNDFRFFGFIPHKKGREGFFTKLAEHPSIAIFYESPHRLMKTLLSLSEHSDLSVRNICVCRELSKMFEEKISAKPQEVLDYFMRKPEKLRGEFVVVLDNKPTH